MGRVRSLKKRRFAEQDIDGGVAGENLEDESGVDPGAIKLLQKKRLRQKGVDSREALAVSGKVEAQGAVLEGQDEEQKAIQYSSFQTSFSKEHGITAMNAEDDMEQYVKEEMAKRLGRPLGSTDDKAEASVRPKSIDELALEAAPRAERRDTEPLTTIVAGVDEVPLGFKHKMKNIEDIERAKRAMLGKEQPLLGTEENHEQARKLRRQFPSSFGAKKKK